MIDETSELGTYQMQDQIDALNGRLMAINSVVSRLASKLQPLQAAEMALGVKSELLEMQLSDAEFSTSAAEIKSRDEIMDAYVELLSSVAKRG